MLKEIDQVTIQSMTMDDLEEVSQLEKLCFSDPWCKENFREEVEHRFTIPLVTKIDNKIVGYICLWNVDFQLEIANIAVAPEFRRRGIGKIMMERVISEAKEKGCESVILSVRESNLPALKLYGEFGFIEIGRRKHYYRFPVEDAMVMVKKL